MKNYFTLLFFLLSITGFSQNQIEKEITTQVEKVTVFFDGAQITRSKSIDLPKGTTLLKFKELSPFVDAKSVQVQAQGEFTILSVNHQVDFQSKSAQTATLTQLEADIKELTDEIDRLNISISIINDQVSFLVLNRNAGSDNQAVDVTSVNLLLKNYTEKVTDLKFNKLKQSNKLIELENKLEQLQAQLKQESSREDDPNTEIWVTVESQQATNGNFTLNYLVNNAGWFPSYDIKANGLDQALQLVYKANLRQDTKIKWDNVRLSFSSNAPKNSSMAPKLETYFLDYYSKPPKYNTDINTVSGYVMDINMEPLPGATVLIKNTSIGTVCDMNGFYSITIPPGNDEALIYSFIGFEEKVIPISDGPNINVQLVESSLHLDEVITIKSNTQTLSSALQGRLAGVSIAKRKRNSKNKNESIAIPFSQVENATSMNFEIQKPYTVKSDNKSLIVEMTTYEIPATFQYYSVPKIIPQVFLKAYITEWEAYNLLEAEANIYVEGTYLGKSIIDPRLASDTLEISLGVDKNISIQRNKIRDKTNRQFIGSKKEETLAWETVIKNNKSQPINIVVHDQVPVSKIEEIEIEIQEKSNGKLNKETGTISWEMKLPPKETKQLQLKYEAKYPKNRNLNIE